MIRVTDRIAIDENEIEEVFVCTGGPTVASRERRREAKLARGRTERLRQPVEQQVE